MVARVDDTVNGRGVNVYPSAVEAVVRRFPQVVEYRATVTNQSPLRELCVEVELAPGESRTVAFRLEPADLALHDREMVRVVEPGSFTVFVGGSSATTNQASFRIE